MTPSPRIPRPARLAILFAAALSAAGAGDEAIEGETLGRGVPSDAAFYLHLRLDPEGDLARRLGPVRKACAEAGFLEEARAILARRTSEPARKKWLERDAVQSLELLEKVDWWGLLSREWLLAARVEERRPEWIALFRVDPAKLEETVRSLERTIHAFSSVSPGFELLSSTRGNDPVTVLYKIVEKAEPAENVPPFVTSWMDVALSGRELCLAGKDGVVLLATSSSLLQRSLQLLEGRGSDVGFSYTARRGDNLSRLGSSPGSGGGFEIHLEPGRLLPDVPALQALESWVAAGRLEGDTLTHVSHGTLASTVSGEAAILRKALLEIAPIEDLLSQRPRETTAFAAASIIDPAMALDLGGKTAAALGIDLDPLLEGMPGGGGERTRDFARAGAAGLTGRGLHATSASGSLLLLETKDAAGGGVLKGLLDAAGRVLGASWEPMDGGGTLFRFGSGEEGKGFLGHSGRLLAASRSEELVRKALAASPGGPAAAEAGGPPPDAPRGLLLEQTDLESPPIILLAGALLRVLARSSGEGAGAADSPPESAFFESARKLTPVIDAFRSTVARSTSSTHREAGAFRRIGKVKFRD